MCTKTKEEREKHYMKHFINNPLFASTLLNLKQAEEAKTADSAIPFHYADDPPRPTSDSLLSQDMAGYMPAQADFIEQFDNYAKWDLRYWFCRRWLGHFTRSEDGCSSYLSCQVKGETKIKKKLWDHGLINLGKFQLMEQWYPKEIQDLYEKMRQFARIVGPVEHDKFIESQALEFELRREIKRLQEYRTAGTTNFCSPRIYNHLKKRNPSNAECTRRSSSTSRTAAPACSGSAGRLTLILAWVLLPEWLRIQVDEVYCPWNSVASLAQRSGVKKKKKRKELCQTVRLVPGAYLEYKSALLNKCNKQGGLKLAQARALIKLDMNKTQKICGFLIWEGYIAKACEAPQERCGPKGRRAFWSLVFELTSHWEKRESKKEIFSCIRVYFLLHPALKYSCCRYYAAELCAR